MTPIANNLARYTSYKIAYLHSFFSSDRILNNVTKQLLIQNNPLELNSQRYIKCPYLLAANLHNC